MLARFVYFGLVSMISGETMTDAATEQPAIPSDLKSWLIKSIDEGFERAAIEQSMYSAGYEAVFANRAVDWAFTARTAKVVTLKEALEAVVSDRRARPAPLPAVVTAPTVSSGTPMPLQAHIGADQNTLQTADRNVDILLSLNSPRIIVFGGLLSDEECDELVNLAKPRLGDSTVLNEQTGAHDKHPHRSSKGAHFQRGENELIRRIEARISELLSFPVDNAEPIQVLRYGPGAEYKPHHDYFDPAFPGFEGSLAVGGQRVATLVMYLSDVEAGGSTVFPTVGVDVLPKKGNAVYFSNTTAENQLDTRTLHGGSPVQSGEKWVATKWIRQSPYVGPGA